MTNRYQVIELTDISKASQTNKRDRPIALSIANRDRSDAIINRMRRGVIKE